MSGPPLPPITPPLSSDRQPPIVKLTVKVTKSKTFLGNGRLDMTVSCNETCSVSARAYTKLQTRPRPREVLAGSGKLKLGAGRRTLHITVARKFRNRTRFRVVLTVEDGAHNVTKTSRTVRVKPA